MHYFDHNATTPLCVEAKEAWDDAQSSAWLNPSSPYRAAARVHARLDDARERVANCFATAPGRVVFNSGGTEGNHAVFAYLSTLYRRDLKVACSAIEHPSVLAPARLFSAQFLELAVTPDGVVDLAAAEERIRAQRPHLVSVMAANNETGVLQPWRELAALCRERGLLFHCDASQWIGRMPLDGLAHCDFVVGCAHKFHGPKGAGFVILSEAADGFRGQQGGGQEHGHRAGTEAVPTILATTAALERAATVVPDPTGRDAFEAAIQAAVADVAVIGQTVPRLWNTSALIAPHGTQVQWIQQLESLGFLVSSGSACATGKSGPSHVLAAMGYGEDAMRRALRLSAGAGTPEDAWQALAQAFIEVAQRPPNAAGKGGLGTVISI